MILSNDGPYSYIQTEEPKQKLLGYLQKFASMIELGGDVGTMLKYYQKCFSVDEDFISIVKLWFQ